MNIEQGTPINECRSINAHLLSAFTFYFKLPCYSVNSVGKYSAFNLRSSAPDSYRDAGNKKTGRYLHRSFGT